MHGDGDKLEADTTVSDVELTRVRIHCFSAVWYWWEKQRCNCNCRGWGTWLALACFQIWERSGKKQEALKAFCMRSQKQSIGHYKPHGECKRHNSRRRIILGDRFLLDSTCHGLWWCFTFPSYHQRELCYARWLGEEHIDQVLCGSIWIGNQYSFLLLMSLCFSGIGYVEKKNVGSFSIFKKVRRNEQYIYLRLDSFHPTTASQRNE